MNPGPRTLAIRHFAVRFPGYRFSAITAAFPSASERRAGAMKKTKRRPARRNPVARALSKLKPKRVPSAKAYRRKPKHKNIGRPDLEEEDGPRLLSCPDSGIAGRRSAG
jgi:hypothetical protein